MKENVGNHPHNHHHRHKERNAGADKKEEAITIDDDSGDDNNGCDANDDGGRVAEMGNEWLAQRLQGMDAEGEADAREQWGRRRSTNLTATDVALANRKRALINNKPVAGWRVMGDKKVFVARTHAGTGAEGFRLSMAFSRKSSSKGKGKADSKAKKSKKR